MEKYLPQPFEFKRLVLDGVENVKNGFIHFKPYAADEESSLLNIEENVDLREIDTVTQNDIRAAAYSTQEMDAKSENNPERPKTFDIFNHDAIKYGLAKSASQSYPNLQNKESDKRYHSDDNKDRPEMKVIKSKSIGTQVQANNGILQNQNELELLYSGEGLISNDAYGYPKENSDVRESQSGYSDEMFRMKTQRFNKKIDTIGTINATNVNIVVNVGLKTENEQFLKNEEDQEGTGYETIDYKSMGTFGTQLIEKDNNGMRPGPSTDRSCNQGASEKVVLRKETFENPATEEYTEKIGRKHSGDLIIPILDENTTNANQNTPAIGRSIESKGTKEMLLLLTTYILSSLRGKRNKFSLTEMFPKKIMEQVARELSKDTSPYWLFVKNLLILFSQNRVKIFCAKLSRAIEVGQDERVTSTLLIELWVKINCLLKDELRESTRRPNNFLIDEMTNILDITFNGSGCLPKFLKYHQCLNCGCYECASYVQESYHQNIYRKSKWWRTRCTGLTKGLDNCCHPMCVASTLCCPFLTIIGCIASVVVILVAGGWL